MDNGKATDALILLLPGRKTQLSPFKQCFVYFFFRFILFCLLNLSIFATSLFMGALAAHWNWLCVTRMRRQTDGRASPRDQSRMIRWCEARVKVKDFYQTRFKLQRKPTVSVPHRSQPARTSGRDLPPRQGLSAERQWHADSHSLQ